MTVASDASAAAAAGPPKPAAAAGAATTTNATTADDKVVLTVEVCVRAGSAADHGAVRAAALAFLAGLSSVRYAEGPLAPPPGQHPVLDAHVASLAVVDLPTGGGGGGGATTTVASGLRAPPPHGTLLLAWDVAWHVLVFQLDGEGPADDDEGEEGAPAYREWALPAAEFQGAWEALYYDTQVKQRLLRYASSALLFAERRVDPRLVAWNRVVLLHGPPGTGKTSLCQALAQKLTIRLGHRYPQGGVLVEVNAHSLFSKWFSESGKLIARLFSKIQEVVEEADSLVFVLVDEVESLTAARKAAVAGSEPTDAIRAVNALLTRLDALKASPNVMVLTTSNITEAIDLAFVDRADIKAFVGNPGEQARYEILRTSVGAVVAAGVVAGPAPLLPYDAAQAAREAAADGGASSGMEDEDEVEQQLAQHLSLALLNVARRCEGFSGRTLRKLPFLAHAAHDFPGGTAVPAPLFMEALLLAVRRERADRAELA